MPKAVRKQVQAQGIGSDVDSEERSHKTKIKSGKVCNKSTPHPISSAMNLKDVDRVRIMQVIRYLSKGTPPFCISTRLFDLPVEVSCETVCQ